MKTKCTICSSLTVVLLCCCSVCFSASEEPEDAITLVIDILKSDDEEMQAVAIAMVREIPGTEVTKALAKELPNLSVTSQVRLLSALGDRGDQAALPAVIAATKFRDESVRIAALKALGELGSDSNVALLAQAAAGARGAEQKAARESLYRLRGPGINKTILANIPSAESAVKIELIRSTSKRNISAGVKTLLKTAQDSDRKVRLESFKALKTIAGEKDLPALVDALIGVQHEADRREAEKTVAAVAHTIDEKNRRAEVRRIAGTVLPSVKDVKIRCSLLRVLGKIGDDSAVPTLRTALKDTDAQVKDAAIRALSDWPTVVPLPDLLKIAQTSDNKIHHVLALRGFVRLIGLGSGRSAKETIGMYKQAMSQASSAGEKKLVLSGLANMKTFAALQMAAGYLEDEALQQEAKVAVATIATKEAKEAIESADPVMGDWQGSWKLDDGNDSGQLVTHVIALGQGKYRAKFLEEFDVRIAPLAVLEGQHRDGVVRFSGPAKYDGTELEVETAIEGYKFTGRFQGQDAVGSFAMEKKVIRLSRTLGAKPPKGAVVLFSGENFTEWKHTGKKPGEDSVQWKLVDGAMEVKPGSGSIITIKEFTDVNLHLEFRTPFMPEARGQGRGNSGVYLQGRYEVQVLDSYGLEGRENECGGIYGVAQPLVNMCAPPTQWQTYDITYHIPRFDSTGKKIDDARMTVIHNGVKIHNNVKVSKATTAAPGGDVGGIYLQDHGNTVQYRNIWLVELPEKPVSD